MIARYEIDTREIKGCKFGSLVYWHEYRHKLQHDADLFSTYFILSFNITFLSGIYLMLTDNLLGWVMPIASITTFMGALEVDAWGYAILRKMNLQKKR